LSGGLSSGSSGGLRFRVAAPEGRPCNGGGYLCGGGVRMWGNRFTRWLWSQAFWEGGGFVRTAFRQLPLLAVYLVLACSEAAAMLAVVSVVRLVRLLCWWRR